MEWYGNGSELLKMAAQILMIVMKNEVGDLLITEDPMKKIGKTVKQNSMQLSWTSCVLTTCYKMIMTLINFYKLLWHKVVFKELL